jgi:hypothetical protein
LRQGERQQVHNVAAVGSDLHQLVVAQFGPLVQAEGRLWGEEKDLHAAARR